MTQRAQGSYLEQERCPSEGQSVWIRAGQFADQVMRGTVRSITDIDHKGLANTYLDVATTQGLKHINLAQVYNHRPRQVQVQDRYGFITVWQ